MSENSKIPCFVCVTQDICRDRGECVQKDAWPSLTEADRKRAGLPSAELEGFEDEAGAVQG